MKTIRYYAPIRAIVKKESEETELRSVKEVLRYIKQEYGIDAYAAAKRALIVINDVSIGLYRGKNTVLADGDVIGFLPVSGGG
jgi:molybdopterin converting factor small subunit